MKILIVEDETKTADYLHKGLTEHSCVVDVARNGLDGRHLALENDYDAIVLDVMLPRLNGWEVLTQLKSSPDLSDIPVIVLTMVDGEAMGVAGGASGVLRKPIDRNRLTALIHKYRPSPGPALVSDRFEPAGV